jgi:uncharacterized membrane protein YgcG
MLLVAVGCEMMHSSVPVTVRIYDAETKAPIQGAEVALVYPKDDSSQSHDSSGKTDTTGVVQVKAVSGDDVAPPQIKVSAAGYLVEQKAMPGETRRAVNEAKPFWSFGTAPHASVETALYLFRGPGAVIELSVPVGYRGLIKADVRVREDVVYEPFQRVFRGSVPMDGAVLVEGPAIIRQEYKPIFTARYLDGNPVPGIPQEAKERNDEVGLRWLRTEGATELFVVGTRAELESYRRSTDRGSGKDSGGSGKSGGGGKGGRKGGGGGGGGDGSSGN